MNRVVIVAAKRTAIGNFLGSLAKIKASELGGLVIKNLINELQLPLTEIDEVIIGQVLTANAGQNPARQASIFAGLPLEIPSYGINEVCGSGLKAVALGARAIALGEADVIIAGGQENMSLSPHLFNARTAVRMGNTAMVDSMIVDGLTDVYNNYHMGITAENIATKFNISRTRQDEFAYNSQQKATNAFNGGKFIDEIVPVELKSKTETKLFLNDEFIKTDLTEVVLSKARPAFKQDGTVTAYNASGINDGAALCVLMSEAKAKELKLPILGYITGSVSVGLEPELMGLGPVYATKALLKKINWNLGEVDLIEANEAFAAQAIAVNDLLGLNTDKVNVNGGAIALGHPIGASGCRILVSLLHEMKRRKAKKGLATLCIGGGMGIALAIEN